MFSGLANKCAVNNGGCEELCLYHALAKDNGISCACAHGKLANDRKSCDSKLHFDLSVLMAFCVKHMHCIIYASYVFMLECSSLHYCSR